MQLEDNQGSSINTQWGCLLILQMHESSKYLEKLKETKSVISPVLPNLIKMPRSLFPWSNCCLPVKSISQPFTFNKRTTYVHTWWDNLYDQFLLTRILFGSFVMQRKKLGRQGKYSIFFFFFWVWQVFRKVYLRFKYWWDQQRRTSCYPIKIILSLQPNFMFGNSLTFHSPLSKGID